jgi:hypothetical protein
MLYSNEKVVGMPKSRAQFTPMRTTAADSRTKIVETNKKNFYQNLKLSHTL